MAHRSPVLESAQAAADRFLRLDGARLRYRDEGRGPAVLLVHGWTLDLEMWQPQVAALCRQFRIVRFDRRGHGLSDGVSSTERDSEDLRALCDTLALREVALVGMSQGARVAALTAATGQRVWALILDGPPPLAGGTETEVPVRHYRALVRERGMAEFRREWARHPLTELRTQDPVRQALLTSALARYSGNDLRSPPHAELSDLPERLAGLKVPVLILGGRHDLPTRVRAADALTSQLGAARSAIAGAGHLPNLDCPDTYSELCRQFLGRHAPASQSS
jgi:3-oxoadipate enol-lactonase